MLAALAGLLIPASAGVSPAGWATWSTAEMAMVAGGTVVGDESE